MPETLFVDIILFKGLSLSQVVSAYKVLPCIGTQLGFKSRIQYFHAKLKYRLIRPLEQAWHVFAFWSYGMWKIHATFPNFITKYVSRNTMHQWTVILRS